MIDLAAMRAGASAGPRAGPRSAWRADARCRRPVTGPDRGEMNAGRRIPAFLTQLTGITDALVRTAPPASQVMAEVADFVGNHPLIAHNASFDRRFWEAELR
ncbi:MAG: 3'-5' exonuclease, partial [Chromatiaceae bacterium]